MNDEPSRHLQRLTFPREKTSMLRFCLGIAGAALALVLAGCGGDSDVQEGPVEWKSGNVQQLAGLRDQMTANAKRGTYAKKSVGETKPAADAKPATDTKPAEKKG
jgi:hypothetical protein